MAAAVAMAALVVIGLRAVPEVRRAGAAVADDRTIVFDDQDVLRQMWSAYKDEYLEQGTYRTVDPQAGGITTSEGESYTMLRAVWVDDPETFARSWQWTKDNLGRPDHLSSWKFGERPDGSYGVQTSAGGQNTASDADTDIAFALLMAYSRWKQDSYLYDAQAVIGSIWTKEVVTVDGSPVLTADDLERLNADTVLVNPSYFAPYAYRAFAAVDPAHDWAGLVDSTYSFLDRLADAPLGAAAAAGLAPGWVTVDRRDGSFSAPPSDLTTDYTYDALRLPWRMALDATWYDEPRARAVLADHHELGDRWAADHRLVASYRRDGTPDADYEAPAMYGGAMGYFTVLDPGAAQQVWADELLPLYSSDAQGPSRDLSYYDSNWVWFGMAMFMHQLPNLNVTGG